MNRLMKLPVLAFIVVLVSAGPVRADQSLDDDFIRYEQLTKSVVTLNSRLDAMQRRLAKAQAEDDQDAVDLTRGQMRAALIERSAMDHERGMLEARHGEALTDRAEQSRAPRHAFVMDIEATWRGEAVSRARKALASDLRQIILHKGANQ